LSWRSASRLLGADGKIGIVNGSTGSTDVVVDIVGYFE